MKKQKFMMNFMQFYFVLFLWEFCCLFYNVLYRFDIISSQTMKVLMLITSILLISVYSIYTLIKWKMKRITKFDEIFSCNMIPLILYTLMLMLMIAPISPSFYWLHDQMKDIMNLIWTIYGLNITIFLVWYCVMIGYLSNMKSTFLSEMGNDFMVDNVDRKTRYHMITEKHFVSIWLLISDFFFMVLATLFVFCVPEILISKMPSYNVFVSIMVWISLILSLLTLELLLVSFLNIILKEKKKLLEDMKISDNDRRVRDEIIRNNEKYKVINDFMNKNSDLHDETKVALENELKAIYDSNPALKID